MPELRRGKAAIEAAAEARGGGKFSPFIPRIEWREDNEKKFILVISPISEITTLTLHEWIPVGTGEKSNGETYTRYETFMSRKDPFIGEDFDRLEDELDATPRDRLLGVAVELEPVFENVKGRQRAKGFSVKTDTFVRKNDDGGEEEVTYPLAGLVVQASKNFWRNISSLDDSQGPLIDLPLEIIRHRTDSDTSYSFVPYVDVPVDLTPLVENVAGISYLADQFEDLVNALEATNDDVGATQEIATALLDSRIAELADKERYDELTEGIEEIPQKFGSKKKSDAKARAPRPKRESQRKAASNGEEPAEASEESGTDRTSSRFAALRAQVEK